MAEAAPDLCLVQQEHNAGAQAEIWSNLPLAQQHVLLQHSEITIIHARLKGLSLLCLNYTKSTLGGPSWHSSQQNTWVTQAGFAVYYQ